MIPVYVLPVYSQCCTASTVQPVVYIDETKTHLVVALSVTSCSVSHVVYVVSEATSPATE